MMYNLRPARTTLNMSKSAWRCLGYIKKYFGCSQKEVLTHLSLTGSISKVKEEPQRKAVVIPTYVLEAWQKQFPRGTVSAYVAANIFDLWEEVNQEQARKAELVNKMKELEEGLTPEEREELRKLL